VWRQGKTNLERDQWARINFANYLATDVVVVLEIDNEPEDVGLETLHNDAAPAAEIAQVILTEASRRTRRKLLKTRKSGTIRSWTRINVNMGEETAMCTSRRGMPIKSSERRKVMIVEDDKDFQTILRDWLDPQYDVVVLSDGSDLLDEIDANEPDMLILDVRLPGPDGLTLCREIRARSTLGSIPILFLTSCKDDETFIRNLEVGGTAFLTKPAGKKNLLARVKEMTS